VTDAGVCFFRALSPMMVLRLAVLVVLPTCRAIEGLREKSASRNAKTWAELAATTGEQQRCGMPSICQRNAASACGPG